MGVNKDWYQKVKIPGQGIRLKKEVYREQLYLALLNNHHGDEEKATEDYFKWTGYMPRGDWGEITLQKDEVLYPVLESMVYVVTQYQVQVMDLLLEIDEFKETQSQPKPEAIKGWKNIKEK